MDTDALWNALDLENEKKDRGIVFWLMGIIPVVCVLCFSFYFFGQNTDQERSEYIDQESKEIINNRTSDKESDDKVSHVINQNSLNENKNAHQNQDQYLRTKDKTNEHRIADAVPTNPLTDHSNETIKRQNKNLFNINSQSEQSKIHTSKIFTANN